MSSPSWEEMESKRQEMIASFKDIASAMNRCVAIIEDYTKLSPSSISAPDKKSASGPALPTGEVKKERKARVPKPKDPKAPKRPPSAYLLFQNEVREDERKAHPDLSYKEVLGVISQKWKDLSEEQRKVFEAAYQDATATFRLEEASYVKDGVPGAIAAAPPATLQAAISAPNVSDDSDSEETSDSDADSPPAPPVNVSASKPKPAPAATPAQSSPAVKTGGSEVKKEKKRKNKEEEAAVAATLEPSAEKKKKKSKKDAAVAA